MDGWRGQRWKLVGMERKGRKERGRTYREDDTRMWKLEALVFVGGIYRMFQRRHRSGHGWYTRCVTRGITWSGAIGLAGNHRTLEDKSALNGVTDTGATWRGFDVIKAVINRVEERCKTKGCYQRVDFYFSFARIRSERSVVPCFTEFFTDIKWLDAWTGSKIPTVCATTIETQPSGKEVWELFKHRLYRSGLIEHHGRKTLTIYFNVLMETAGKKWIHRSSTIPGSPPLIDGGSEKFIGCSRRYLRFAQIYWHVRCVTENYVIAWLRIDQFATGVIGYLTDAHL